MPSIDNFVADDWKHIEERAICPLLPSVFRSDPDPIWDNVQGDVFMLFPKIAENFVFFRIKDVTQFKNDLKSFRPSSSRDVAGGLRNVSFAKKNSTVAHLVFRQIAFSRAGLMQLLDSGVQLGDYTFDNLTMLQDKKRLGDQSPYFEPFVTDDLHGVFTIAASSEELAELETNAIKKLFADSIISTEGMTLKGRTRPRPFRGHEHFGYKDGVSQPALRGLVKPHTGQLQADPGVIIMGHKGDPVLDNPNEEQRPEWTKDGSLMVFRNLEQDVLGFEAYIKQRGVNWRKHVPDPDAIQPPLTDQEGADLMGAQIVGRWKSGAPIALAHYRDDKKIARDKNMVNNFDYSVPHLREPTDRFCPFTAHLRKTAPRNLDPYMNRKFLESALIIRGGIPYGTEITKDEREAGDSLSKRGLFFICYQSSLDNGFVRQTVDFAGNDYFPTVSLRPTGHGQDAILGNPAPGGIAVELNDQEFPKSGEVVLNVRRGEETVADVPGFSNPAWRIQAQSMKFFVTSRGGEYFFVPSIPLVERLAQGFTLS